MNKAMSFASAAAVIGEEEIRKIRSTFPEKMERKDVAAFGKAVAGKCIEKLKAEGKMSWEIADTLGLSEGTVRYFLKKMAS